MVKPHYLVMGIAPCAKLIEKLLIAGYKTFLRAGNRL